MHLGFDAEIRFLNSLACHSFSLSEIKQRAFIFLLRPSRRRVMCIQWPDLLGNLLSRWHLSQCSTNISSKLWLTTCCRYELKNLISAHDMRKYFIFLGYIPSSKNKGTEYFQNAFQSYPCRSSPNIALINYIFFQKIKENSIFKGSENLSLLWSNYNSTSCLLLQQSEEHCIKHWKMDNCNLTHVSAYWTVILFNCHHSDGNQKKNHLVSWVQFVFRRDPWYEIRPFPTCYCLSVKTSHMKKHESIFHLQFHFHACKQTNFHVKSFAPGFFGSRSTRWTLTWPFHCFIKTMIQCLCIF